MVELWEPYNVKRGRNYKRWRVQTASGAPVCTIAEADCGDLEVSRAFLIGAAPRLLMAASSLLESYLDLCDRNGLDASQFGVVQTAREAIRDATR